MLNIHPGQIYEWIRSPSNGREMTDEARIESRFMIESGPHPSKDGVNLWRHSKGRSTALEFWLEEDYIRIYSQNSLNLVNEESAVSRYFTLGRIVSFRVDTDKEYRGLVIKINDPIYTLRDWYGNEDFIIRHIEGDNYTFFGDGLDNVLITEIIPLRYDVMK